MVIEDEHLCIYVLIYWPFGYLLKFLFTSFAHFSIMLSVCLFGRIPVYILNMSSLLDIYFASPPTFCSLIFHSLSDFR